MEVEEDQESSFQTSDIYRLGPSLVEENRCKTHYRSFSSYP